MIIIPLNDRILVRSSRHATERRPADLIPDLATVRGEQGTVIAVGTGASEGSGPPVALTIKAGDTVLFDGQIADDVTIGGAAYVIMKAKHARRVECNSRPRHADEPLVQPTWHGPHHVVVWSK